MFFSVSLYTEPMCFSHPQRVCMTYVEHCTLSLELSALFFYGGICAFIHAFIPDIFPNSSTQISEDILGIIQNSGCNRNEKEE